MKLMDCIEDRSKLSGVSKCDICTKQGINQSMFEGELEYFNKPFRGSKPLVMVLGQDPTISKGEVNSVLDLEDTKSKLFHFVISEIIEGVGLGKDDIYATNLIKCRFPNNKTPKLISQGKIKEYLAPFFNNCREHLKREVRLIKPKIVLSLGEPVHQMLRESYHWEVPSKMKDAFGKSYEVSIKGDKVEYIPCIHYNSRNKSLYRSLWQSFIENLIETVDKM